jgi:glutamate-1-semialdehyde aminotransferase
VTPTATQSPLNPLQVENIKMIAEVAQQEEVSLHMSGTEAVMCAVRLARFNSGGKPLVRHTGTAPQSTSTHHRTRAGALHID